MKTKYPERKWYKKSYALRNIIRLVPNYLSISSIKKIPTFFSISASYTIKTFKNILSMVPNFCGVKHPKYLGVLGDAFQGNINISPYIIPR